MSFFFCRLPHPSDKDRSYIRTLIELVDIDITLFYGSYRTILISQNKSNYSKKKNIHCTFFYKEIRTAQLADHLNQLHVSLPDNPYSPLLLVYSNSYYQFPELDQILIYCAFSCKPAFLCAVAKIAKRCIVFFSSSINATNELQGR